MSKLLNPLVTSDEERALHKGQSVEDDTAQPHKKLLFVSVIVFMLLLMFSFTLEREIEPARASLRAMSLQEATFRGRLIRLLCRGRSCFADDILGAGSLPKSSPDPGSTVKKRQSALGGNITLD
ncbi:MAG: hypothetical protein PHC51_00555 [bacterium]|nr:hypothetical protein [bacterium]